MSIGIGRAVAVLGSRAPVQMFVSSSALAHPLRSRFTNEDSVEAVERARLLSDVGVLASVHMRELPVSKPSDAESFVSQMEMLVGRLRSAGVEQADVSVKMEQLGYHVAGASAAQRNLARIVERCARSGITVTVDMEYPEEVEDTLQVWKAVQKGFPKLGIAIQAYLLRSEQDCSDLADMGARVRLCKGAYQARGDAAFSSRQEVDLSFVRCARRLVAGTGYPMFATHDRRLWEIVSFLVGEAGRSHSDWEMQTLQGVAPNLVAEALAAEIRVRCYLPFGSQTYPWLLHRVTERPSNLLLLAGRSAWSDPFAFTSPQEAAG